MLCRLVDTATDYGFDVGFLPKYGIVFDIENSANGNFAFAGKGSGVLEGVVDGYSYTKIAMEQANTVYRGYMKMDKANRFIVSSILDGAYLGLPELSQVRNALSVELSTPFCMRVSVMADFGSNGFRICGRNNITSSDNSHPWNIESLPVIVHWDGSYFEAIDMEQGDSTEFLLVYDPNSTATLNGWPTKYTARIINRLT